MKILFIHQNMPGQYKHLVHHFSQDLSNEVVFMTHRKKGEIENVTRVSYELTGTITAGAHPFIQPAEQALIYGQAVARKCLKLRKNGFIPDVILAHIGWGESIFVKDVYPDSQLLQLCEYYYHAFGSDCFFDPEEKATLDAVCQIRAKNASLLLGLDVMDWGISPTYWQCQQYPSVYRQKISVIHDGIDVSFCRPEPGTKVQLPNGKILRKGDEVITFVARNFEPYRGFPEFMRTLEILCRERPQAEFIVVGGDSVSYGGDLPAGFSYREHMLREVSIDETRVHFVGRLPYEVFQQVFRVSMVHIYLTYPFVLSWSLLEAMSSECLIVASATSPVLEVIEDGVNGLLVDFHCPADIAARVVDAVKNQEKYEPLRRIARQTVLARYSLKDCLAQQVGIITKIASGESFDTLINNHPEQDIITETPGRKM